MENLTKEMVSPRVKGSYDVIFAISKARGMSELDFGPAFEKQAEAQMHLHGKRYEAAINICDCAIFIANKIVVDYVTEVVESNSAILNGKANRVNEKLAEAKALLEKSQDLRKITPLCSEVLDEINRAIEAEEKRVIKLATRREDLQERLNVLQGRLKEVNKDIQSMVEGILLLPELALEKASKNLDRFEQLIVAAEKYFDETKPVIFGKL